jgi:hypothetical protein
MWSRRCCGAREERGRAVKKLVVIACAAAALAFPASALAVWGWTPVAAEDTLYEEGLDWDSGHERVRLADCKGYRQAPNWVNNGTRFFRKLTCFVRTNGPPGENAYFIRVTVLGEYKWNYTFLRYAS